MSDLEQVPHSSADVDSVDYVDERGLRIFDRDWTCPNCGEVGQLLFRPGSKSTCGTCFWVVDGRYNDHVLEDWPLRYRDAQRLLAARGDDWGGSPGTVATRLRRRFDQPHEAMLAMESLHETDAEVPVPDAGARELWRGYLDALERLGADLDEDQRVVLAETLDQLAVLIDSAVANGGDRS